MRKFGLLSMLFVLVAPLACADVVVGLPATPGDGNCIPFGCAYSTQGTEYQQLYSASQFTAPITITELEFYDTDLNSGATAMNSGLWTISLSTTSAGWNTLSATFANNIGANNTAVFSGNLSQPWAFGDTLTIVLSTPFTYNPSNGNLLMDVAVSGTTAPGGYIFFDANSGNNYLGRVFEGGLDSGYGMVTGFSGGSPTSTPEPSSVALFGLGIAVFGLARRRLCR
jgi:hypothetical protein